MNWEDKIQSILIRAKKELNVQKAYRKIFGLIDLTSLETSDNKNSVKHLCEKALEYSNRKDLPAIPAICIYPVFADAAKGFLGDTDIKLACVAGVFPHSQSPLKVRLEEAKYALENGADEIDMVISVGRFLDGDFDFTYREVNAFKEVCGDKHLKVILETGLLRTEDNIRKASQIAMDAGADFIKTSTGKVQPAATLEAMFYMLEEIRTYVERSNKKVGIKPAGGIREAKDALDYYLLVKEILGEKYLNPDLFRIGASSLAEKIIKALELPEN